MSTAVDVTRAEEGTGSRPWALWSRQIAALFRIELRKNLFGARAIPLYLLALIPVGIFALMLVVPGASKLLRNPVEANQIYGDVFIALTLRTLLFFACAWTFMNCIRGEVIDRSLHYYFLSPVRREVLLVGKYLAGLAATSVVFVATTLATLTLFYAPRGATAALDYLFAGPGLAHAVAYIGAIVLGCLGYGAVFIALGLFFRNPIFPALALYGWEGINFLLPPILKKITVIHYLESLLPVPISEGPFAIVAEPSPIWVSVPGLIVFAVVLLAIAAMSIRRMEIRYGTD